MGGARVCELVAENNLTVYNTSVPLSYLRMYTVFTGSSNNGISEMLWVTVRFGILGYMFCGSASCMN
jgi:hypothetical protein